MPINSDPSLGHFISEFHSDVRVVERRMAEDMLGIIAPAVKKKSFTILSKFAPLLKFELLDV